jgi:hypothetical protein
MSSATLPEASIEPPKVTARRRMARPFLSPEISELLDMLEAFESSLALHSAASSS